MLIGLRTTGPCLLRLYSIQPAFLWPLQRTSTDLNKELGFFNLPSFKRKEQCIRQTVCWIKVENTLHSFFRWCIVTFYDSSRFLFCGCRDLFRHPPPFSMQLKVAASAFKRQLCQRPCIFLYKELNNVSDSLLLSVSILRSLSGFSTKWILMIHPLASNMIPDFFLPHPTHSFFSLP